MIWLVFSYLYIYVSVLITGITFKYHFIFAIFANILTWVSVTKWTKKKNPALCLLLRSSRHFLILKYYVTSFRGTTWVVHWVTRPLLTFFGVIENLYSRSVQREKWALDVALGLLGSYKVTSERHVN